MRKRFGSILFLGTLGSAFLLGACGDDGSEVTCSEVCDRNEACGNGVGRSECIEECKASGRSTEELECLLELPCEASLEDTFGCLEVVEVSSSCETYCSKPCIQAQIGRDECEILCAANLSPEEQDCVAEIDGETCEGQQACLELEEAED